MRKLHFLLLLLFIVFFLGLAKFIVFSDKNFPDIHGTFIPNPVALENFVLIDHFGEPFTNRQLKGNWHIISYGFTNCPDICPTTLQVLTRFKKLLDEHKPGDELKVLFYTIDPQRDQYEHLGEYMKFFHSDFIGLTINSAQPEISKPFNESLGIKVVFTELPKEQQNEYTGTYSVSHGVMLSLINPNGQLQAVFRPQRSRDGTQFFTSEQVLKDYLRVRGFLES